MYRIGIDCVEIARMADKAAREAFVSRVFGSDELSEISARGSKPVNFAVCFAAKEAFAKALGTGFSGFFPGDAEVIWESGKPALVALGPAKERLGGRRVHLSLSHEGGLALAFVVLEAVEK